MTQRQAATLLTTFAVLYIAGLVLLAPRLDLLDPHQADWQAAAALGVVVASPAFLAIWAVHGRQRAAVRLPLTLWLQAIFYLAGLYGEVRYFGRGDVDAVLFSTVASVTASIALMLVLRLLRAVRGWRLERVETAVGLSTLAADSNRQRQFTVRTLLIWTAAAAVLCAGLRSLVPYHSIRGDELSTQILGTLIEGAVLGLVLAMAGLPVVSAAWFVLAAGRRTILRVVLIAVTGAGIAGGIAAVRFLLEVDEPEFIGIAAGVEAGVLLAGLSAAGLARACGYRLVRPSKKQPASEGASPNIAPRPSRNFAFACASLAAAWVALACCAPARFELWHRADVRQGLAGMGWEADFDDDGRIVRMAAIFGHDLSGGEFEIADLADLESLEFAHLPLSDVQLAQYPIHNPALAGLKSLDLCDTSISDAGLAHLERFPNIERLNLSLTKITDAGIASLAALPLREHLARLELKAADLSDEAVESLAQLGRLESLDLQLTGISEEGVCRLRESLPKVTIAYGASDGSLNEALVANIRILDGASIGIARIPKQPLWLHARGRLCVSGPSQTVTPPPATGLTDAGAAMLAGQTELEQLDLRDSAVTDAGLTSLVKLANLRRLDLRGAPVTEIGCRKLAAVLTSCEILR